MSWRTVRLGLMVAVALAAHVYGWQITRINLVDLVTGLPNMRHIVVGLLQPELLERVGDLLRPEAVLAHRISTSTASSP